MSSTPTAPILVRANNFDAWGDSVAHYRYIQWVLRNRKPAAGTGILGYENIRNEGKDLADRTIINVVPTPLARQRDSQVEDRGPGHESRRAHHRGRPDGRHPLRRRPAQQQRSVHRPLPRLVFKEERIDGREVGASTIFLDDIRVTTTITDRRTNGPSAPRSRTRSIEKVYEEGQTWVGQAFVVDSLVHLRL